MVEFKDNFKTKTDACKWARRQSRRYSALFGVYPSMNGWSAALCCTYHVYAGNVRHGCVQQFLDGKGYAEESLPYEHYSA